MKSGEKALTRVEWEKLQGAIDNIEDELLIKMAISTGIRRDDLVSIRIGNISLQDATLTFHESKKDIDRTISISPEIVQLIKKYLNTVKNEKREHLFDFSGRTAWNKLDRACRMAGIPPRPFHALRATCIKFCKIAGWTPEQVSKLTGDSFRVIQEHYMTPSEAEMKEVTQKKAII